MLLQEAVEINQPQMSTLKLLTAPDALQPHNLCSSPKTDLLDKSPVGHTGQSIITLERRIMSIYN